MIGLKEERKRAAGEEEISLIDMWGENSSSGSEPEKELGWNGSREKSGLAKGWMLTKRGRSPGDFSPMASQGRSGSGEMGFERGASGCPRMGSGLAKT